MTFVTGLLAVVLGLAIAAHGIRKKPRDKLESRMGFLVALLACLSWYFGTREAARLQEQLEASEQKVAAEAARLQEQLEASEQKVAALEDAARPRTLSSSAHVYIVEKLSEHAGQVITVSPVGNDAEVNNFAREVEIVLTDAGWNVTFDEIGMIFRPVIGLEVGVSTSDDPPQAALALVEAFREVGLATNPGSLAMGSKAPISIMVGEKPR